MKIMKQYLGYIHDMVGGYVTSSENYTYTRVCMFIRHGRIDAFPSWGAGWTDKTNSQGQCVRVGRNSTIFK